VVAILHVATALLKAGSGQRYPHQAERRPPAVRRRAVGVALRALACGLPLFAASAGVAANDKVRITGLGDVAFGTITNLAVDSVNSQSLCLYSSSGTGGYNVTASGSGAGGAFELASGPQSLPFDVQWSNLSGQSSGAQLTPNVPLTGQVSTASQQTCNSGPATSASLILVVRATALSSATAGIYNGTLTLIVGPE
jgi:hypothetical protein